MCVTESVKHRLHTFTRNDFMLNIDLVQYIRITFCLRSCHRNVSFPLLKACPRQVRSAERMNHCRIHLAYIRVFFFNRKFTLNCYSKSKARGRMLPNIFFKHVERKVTVLFVRIEMNVLNTMSEVPMHQCQHRGVHTGQDCIHSLQVFIRIVTYNVPQSRATLFMIHVSIPLILERWFIHPSST